jgi:hypothetical protein
MAGVAAAMKAGDDQEGIGLHEEKERVGKFLRARPLVRIPNLERLLEVVVLYMKPPDNAVVLCVDDETGIRALDRTQLPLRAAKPLVGPTNDANARSVPVQPADPPVWA